MSKPLRIATRKSPLAQAQAHLVGQQHQALTGQPYVLIPCSTQGDRRQDILLHTVGGKGLFVKEVEQALLDGQADLAVHSLKDMPITQPATLPIQAILKRTHPGDVWIGQHDWRSWPKGAVIGTSSPRRHGQILHVCPHAVVRPLRGNIDTRLAKYQQGQYTAIILAEAGLLRRAQYAPDWEMPVYQPFCSDDVLPAAGQGALAIQCAPHFCLSQAAQAGLHHTHTAICVGLERDLVAKLGAQCQSPLAVYAYYQAGIWHLQARICGPQGQMLCHTHVQSDQPNDVSTAAYQDMQAQHAIDILQQGWQDA